MISTRPIFAWITRDITTPEEARFATYSLSVLALVSLALGVGAFLLTLAKPEPLFAIATGLFLGSFAMITGLAAVHARHARRLQKGGQR